MPVLLMWAGSTALGQYTYQSLRSFEWPTGASPAGLIEGSDGVFYGTAATGGSSTAGTVFRMTKDGTGYSVIWDFGTGADDGPWPQDLIEGSDTALYGTTSGAVFRINRDGSGYAVLHRFDPATGDGTSPAGGVLEGTDGMLYGATKTGGAGLVGTIYRLNRDGTDYRLIRQFGDSGEGLYPDAPLIEGSDGALYGTTHSGGAYGVVFRIGKDGGGFKVLRSFQGPDGDGSNPESPLMEGSDGMLYGTTYVGGMRQNGDGGGGTVFKLNKDGSSYQVLRMFRSRSTDAQNPLTGLVEAADGSLFGTTHFGGSNNLGAVFKLNKDGSDYAVLVSFVEREGRYPDAPLVVASDAAVYGATSWGGAFGYGVVFRVTSAPPLRLSLMLGLNHAVSVQGFGAPGASYNLQVSQRLIPPDWQIVGQGIADATGRFSCVDSNAGMSQTRFYRSTSP